MYLSTYLKIIWTVLLNTFILVINMTVHMIYQTKPTNSVINLFNELFLIMAINGT